MLWVGFTITISGLVFLHLTDRMKIKLLNDRISRGLERESKWSSMCDELLAEHQ